MSEELCLPAEKKNKLNSIFFGLYIHCFLTKTMWSSIPSLVKIEARMRTENADPHNRWRAEAMETGKALLRFHS